MKELFGLPCRAIETIPGSAKWRPIRASLAIKRTTNLRMTTFSDDLQRVHNLCSKVITYKTDEELYGVDDYWATPDETLAKRAGDCEDLAILQWSALADMGYPHNLFAMVVCDNIAEAGMHAFLVANASGTNYILDNLRSDVYTDTESTTYVPLYAYGISQNWSFI